jgi:hypothetical protein
MKPFTLNPKSLLLAGLALSSALFMGCETMADSNSETTNEDGQSAFITSEVDQMGQSLSDLSTDGLGKAAAPRVDTITGEKIVERFGYVEACECFIRKATYSNSNGYERTRLDSVTLLDSAGEVLTKWDRSLIAKIIHKRHITRNKGNHDMDVHVNTEATFKSDNGVWVGVWNGTMTGSFDGEAFKSATIENVTRSWVNGKFRFPSSGSVTVTRPLRIYAIEFLGEGDARATITHRISGKVTVITIDRNYQGKPAV